VPYGKLNVPDPLAVGIDATGLTWLSPLIKVSALFGLFSTMIVQLLGQTRIFFAMSRDGLLPPYFARVHPRYRTPHVTTIWTGLAVAILSAFCNIDEMANLCNIGTLFAFVLVCAGVIILRFRDPARPRPFRVPFGIVLPILGILFCLFLMFGLDRLTWLRFFVWLVIGLVLYAVYGYRKSRLRGAGAGASPPS